MKASFCKMTKLLLKPPCFSDSRIETIQVPARFRQRKPRRNKFGGLKVLLSTIWARPPRAADRALASRAPRSRGSRPPASIPRACRTWLIKGCRACRTERRTRAKQRLLAATHQKTAPPARGSKAAVRCRSLASAERRVKARDLHGSGKQLPHPRSQGYCI